VEKNTKRCVKELNKNSYDVKKAIVICNEEVKRIADHRKEERRAA
jgi:hypothetical protein